MHTTIWISTRFGWQRQQGFLTVRRDGSARFVTNGQRKSLRKGNWTRQPTLEQLREGSRLAAAASILKPYTRAW